MAWPNHYRQVGYFHEMVAENLRLNPATRSLRSYLEEMFEDEEIPTLSMEGKDWDEVYGLPKFLSENEGPRVRIIDDVGTKGKRYREECKRVKRIMLMVTPNTMVCFPRTLRVFVQLGPRVRYSANLYDIYHEFITYSAVEMIW